MKILEIVYVNRDFLHLQVYYVSNALMAVKFVNNLPKYVILAFKATKK